MVMALIHQLLEKVSAEERRIGEQECFISHDFTQIDLRKKLTRGLQQLNLRPYFADKELTGDFILHKVCRKILVTRASVVDLTHANPNVYFELGVAIGLNKPVFIVLKQGADVPTLLENFVKLRFTAYANLEKDLVEQAPGWLEHSLEYHLLYNNHCHFIDVLCRDRQRIELQRRYLIIDEIENSKKQNQSNLSYDPDFQVEVREALDSFHFVQITLHELTIEDKFRLCDYCRGLRTSNFAVCHLTEQTSLNVYLLLGLLIGLGIPPALVVRQTGSTTQDPWLLVPSMLRGLDLFIYKHYKMVSEQLGELVEGLLNRTETQIYRDKALSFYTNFRRVDTAPSEQNADHDFNNAELHLKRESVSVFTPKGDSIELPAGSTPIDFAYRIHTELGHRCRGANVNGRLVPLDFKLSNGDQVSIIAAKRGGPSRDWLNPSLEYIATQHARSKIRDWLRKQGREVNIQHGKQILEKELKRLSVTLSLEAVSKLFNYESLDDFIAAVGYVDVNSYQIAQKILELERRDADSSIAQDEVFTNLASTQTSKVTNGLIVQGAEGMSTQLGRCCNPVPGDAIVGYVTKGRGVTIHRTSCPNIVAVLRKNISNRLVDVQWTTIQDAFYPVKIHIKAYDRAALMRDVTSLIADEQIEMHSVEALIDQKDNMAIINATIEIEDVTQLMRILTKIGRLPNIVECKRKI